MKYGISSVPDETPFDKRDVSQEISMASESEAAATMASSRHGDAVIFSIQFYGKTIGEVGMMDQDLSELDWKKFKCYLFQNLLSMNHQENICVSYSDEEGDKLPIDSDEEYQEALKVAKKKAEMHDKLVLDITRQGGFPAMLSLVSSGIKRVSSSPPKEGGISFFKASSPPKDAAGFKAAVGTERKLFQGFFMPDKGPIPGHVQGVWGYDCDEALECGKVNTSATTTTTTTTTTPVPTARTDCKRGPPVRALRNSPPNLLFKFEAPHSHNLKSTTIETSACQDVFGAGNGRSTTGARPKDVRMEREFSEQPPEWFTSYMYKFRAEVSEEVSERVVARVKEILRNTNEITTPVLEEPQSGRKFVKHTELRKVASSVDMNHLDLNHTELRTVDLEDRPQRKSVGLKKSLDSDASQDDSHDNEKKKKMETPETLETKLDTLQSESCKLKKKDDKNLGVKRKKLIKEEERLMKKQEKIERKKCILTSKYADEMDKASRTQEKVFAKMEGLRKKQFCSQEELSKLRKMVDKQQRFITAEQRQQRRNERKAGYQKSGKSKKINIDNKGFPVDASLLHAALQELEALAEDSTSDCAGATTRGYDALYLKDITFPDGSVVSPGTEFVKTWRVVNNGVLPWNEKTTLCKWSQVRFRGSPAGWKLKPSMKRVVCPPLEPGQEGDISITFTAPSEPGWYATHWRFCQRGRVFGNQMWCAIHVVEENTACEASKAQLGKTVVDENGVTKRALTMDEMQELSAAIILQQGVGDPVFDKYTLLGVEPPQNLIIPPREELGPQNDLGIVENYYDAEDPVQRECTEGLQQLTLNCPDEPNDGEMERKERDLISFEEEAEVVDSGTSTPEMVSNVSQAHSVVPLKEMAKESVESLIIKDQELKSQFKPTILTVTEEIIQPDSISMSSGSFSELDSEDQAILNESDSEGSDHEYYVVHLPDCFNMSSLHDGLTELSESNVQEMSVGGCEEAERPDSPDFLTADEDDRTTAVASDSSDDLTCPVNEHDYASRSSTISHTSSSVSRESSTKHQTQDKNTSFAEDEEDDDRSATTSTLPDPPTDTKPFMFIPDEAIRTTALYTTIQMPSSATEQSSQSHKEQDRGTWASGTDNAQNVVCEQPYSAQHKESKQDGVSQEGVAPATGKESTTSPTNPSQLPVDLVGALPDELVSIIPEDLVRGAWNTARSFITRINQEMLSPTSDSPGRVYPREEESPSDQQRQQQQPPQPPPTVAESVPQREEAAQENITTTEREPASPLPPPMQQLEDMGFHNREVNERLLTKYNGDVSCAVAELIILNCH